MAMLQSGNIPAVLVVAGQLGYNPRPNKIPDQPGIT
jgi:hypothetical protein